MTEVASHSKILENRANAIISDQLKHSYVSNFSFSDSAKHSNISENDQLEFLNKAKREIEYKFKVEPRYSVATFVTAMAVIILVSIFGYGIATKQFFGSNENSIATIYYHQPVNQGFFTPTVAGDSVTSEDIGSNP